MSGKLRVLLVEDSGSDRQALRVALEHAGYRVSDASSGEEGLARLRAEPFDAVASDCRMGFLDGIGLLEIARRDHPGVGRVLITGAASFEVAHDAINRAGVHVFLQKPVEAGALADSVKTCLERARDERA